MTHLTLGLRPLARLTTIALAAITAVSLAPRALAQVEAQPRLEDGKVWAYDLSLDLTVAQDERVFRVVQGARLRLTTIEVDDEGSARVRAAFDRLTMLWAAPPDEQLQFEWRREDDPDAAKAASANEAFTKLCRALAGGTFEFTVGPDGGVTNLSGLETALQVLEDREGEGLSRSMLGLFEPSQLPETLAPIWTGDGLAGRRVREGQGWQSSRRTPAGPAGALEFTTDWVVTSIMDDRVEARAEESAQVLRPSVSDSATPSIEIREFGGAIELIWDRNEGCLARRGVDRRMAAVWTMGDLTITQTQTARSRLSRVSVAAD
ncbi:MAG: hypothetical protein VYC34_06180 [Planctomycetota bacterium]|nr:hypothetical protein [Planctomycetota bacterium]